MIFFWTSRKPIRPSFRRCDAPADATRTSTYSGCVTRGDIPSKTLNIGHAYWLPGCGIRFSKRSHRAGTRERYNFDDLMVEMQNEPSWKVQDEIYQLKVKFSEVDATDQCDVLMSAAPPRPSGSTWVAKCGGTQPAPGRLVSKNKTTKG